MKPLTKRPWWIASTTLVATVVLTVGSWALFIWGLKLTIPLWPVFING